jgi:hypothetical protein
VETAFVIRSELEGAAPGSLVEFFDRADRRVGRFDLAATRGRVKASNTYSTLPQEMVVAATVREVRNGFAFPI